MEINFKKLEENDLPLVHKWRNAEHVVEWYGKTRPTFEEIKKKYVPRIHGNEPTYCFLILLDEKPIGFIQTYRVSDHPEYEKNVRLDEKTAGIDLFIGEKEYLHKGLGGEIIKQFLKEITFKMFDISSCVVSPDPNNKIAIRAYEKVGFSYVKMIRNSERKQEEYLMKISEDAIDERQK